MARRYQTLRGFKDLLPGETEHWQAFERDARELCRRYGFREIRTPHLEPTELFVRSVGQETDIVGKEMFTFDAGDDSVTLRPEITASVCRSFVEHSLGRQGQTRLYYIGPCFRRERPQKGRLRQFHQVGVEILDEPAPGADVELIALGLAIVEAAGVPNHQLLINSIGDDQCRPRFRQALIDFLKSKAEVLCEDCRRRIDRNPLRVLDCKNAPCQAALLDAPRTVDHLCEPCRDHFAQVTGGLEALGIPYQIEPKLVRGLDYYVRTTFEVRAVGLGSQDAVLGGGRYDGLVAELGGGPVPAIGWAAGMERLLIASGKEEQPVPQSLDAFIVTLGEAARARVLPLVQALRRLGLAVGWDSGGRGLNSQMKRADRQGARSAVLIGDDELARERVTIKDLATGQQGEGPLAPAALADYLRQAGQTPAAPKE